MDHTDIYDFFKRKLGHDIAEVLYELTQNYMALTIEKQLIHSKRIRCRKKTINSVENYIKILEIEPETYVEFTIWFKLIGRKGSIANVTSRKILGRDLRVGEINLTNSSNTVLIPGVWDIEVYGKMLSAGKIVVDTNRCKLIVRRRCTASSGSVRT